jgi:DNA-binding transcriptional LysR family regulator
LHAFTYTDYLPKPHKLHGNNDMTRESLDLNLIPVLRVMVHSRSVTRAAATLGMSQPQLSRALGRLRKQTGDLLLARAGAGMEPTETALALVKAFDTAIDTASTLINERRAFEATTSHATFLLSMNDYESAVFLPALFAKFVKAAPHARLAVVSRRPNDIPSALLSGQTDLAIGRFTSPPQTLRYKHLFKEQLVTLVRRRHPILGSNISMEQFVKFPHILVAPGGNGDFTGLLDEELSAVGIERRVPLSVSQFMMAPLVTARTDAILILPQRLFPIVQPWGLEQIAAPIKLPGFQVSMLWRDRNHKEPRHRWLREQLLQVVQEINS